MREHYGSFVPGLLGVSNINRTDIAKFMAAVATAILQWEPRFHVTAITPIDATRDGSFGLRIEGEYRPRATYGDLRAEGGARRTLEIGAGTTLGSWNVNQGGTA